MRLFLFIFFCFVCEIASFAQVKFFVEISENPVRLGERFQVVVTVLNGEVQQYSPPSFQGCRLVGGPNRHQSFSYSNGNISRSSKFTYELIPTADDKIVIGSAELKSKGAVYTTSPLQVKVIANPKVAPPSGGGTFDKSKPFFIQASVDKVNAYVGEQIVLKYTIYTQSNIERLEPPPEIKFPDFFQKAVETSNSPVQDLVIKGQHYRTRVIQQFVLYPLKAGTLTIPQFLYRASVVMDDESLFGILMPEMKEVDLVSNKLELHVKDAPSDIGGEILPIGEGSANWSIDRVKCPTNQAVKLRLDIKISGDPKRINPPILNIDPSIWRSFSPKLISENTEASSSGFMTHKVFEYALVPLKTGHHMLDPKFNYFNIQSNDVLAVSNHFEVEVVQGDPVAPTDSDNAHKENFTFLGQPGKSMKLLGWASFFIALATIFALAWKSFFSQNPPKNTKKDKGSEGQINKTYVKDHLDENLKCDDFQEFVDFPLLAGSADVKGNLNKIFIFAKKYQSGGYLVPTELASYADLTEEGQKEFQALITECKVISEENKYGGKEINPSEVNELTEKIRGLISRKK